MGSSPSPDLNSVWQKVLGELEVSLHEKGGGFKMFLKPTQLLSTDDNTAIIGVTSTFSSAQIKARYESALLAVLQTQLPNIQKLDYHLFTPEETPLNDNSTSPKSKSQHHKSTVKQKPGAQRSDQNQQASLFEQQPQLATRYHFNSFVVGASNRLAYSAAKLVAEKPGTDYNPLFLYGPAGVGKTHLMWAMYGEIARRNPELTLMYTTIEEFYKTFVDSVRKSEAFTNKFREVDVLLIDDIQFIKKKETTQEEFFHTFNALHQASKQIVICSDRPPKEIPELEERLRSRFEWGMVVDIQPPDLETRIAILQSKAISKNFDLPLEVAEAIAERNASNIRELEGGFNKILMHCELHGGEATVELVEEVLGGVQGQSYGRRKPSPRLILTEIAQYFGVTVTDITGKRRTRDIVLPRQVAMYLLRDELGLSFPQIGSHLGGRDHTTIMHGFGKIELLVSQRAPIVQDISGVKQRIGQEASLV